MLTNDEAVVVSLGLLAAKRLGLESAHDTADGALRKLHRVLPTTLRRQVEALEHSLGFTAPPLAGVPAESEALLSLADAIARHRRDPGRVQLLRRGSCRHAGSAPTASSSTGAGGTSPPTTTTEATCGRFASIGSAESRWSTVSVVDPPEDFDAVAYVSSFARAGSVGPGR